MKQTTNLLMMTGLLACCVGSAAQTAAAHFDMSLDDNGNLVENISGQAYPVSSQLPACTVEGLDGVALRFDGYSNYVKAGLPVGSLSKETLTVSITLAAEAYPMVAVKDEAEATPAYATICGLIDDIAVCNQADTPSPFTAQQWPDFSYPASRRGAACEVSF